MPFTVTVHRDVFVLQDDEVLGRVKRELEAAAACGGRFVTLGDLASGPEVLVTPATPVRIDSFIEQHDADEAWEFIDFDQP